MTEASEAESLIQSLMPPRSREAVALAEATGRTLAGAVHAERDQPPFDRVTMDGVALRHADWLAGARRYRILATQAAGVPAMSLTGERVCIEVMTGALLPEGADIVIPVERYERQSGSISISAGTEVKPGRFIHPQGSDRRAGERVLPAGLTIGAAESAVLASVGKALVEVARLARVAVISTGDELVDVAEPVAGHQIRSSNDFAIAAALEGAKLALVTRLRLRDDPERILATVADCHAASDALILSGGVSMGQFDFVPSVLEALGCKPIFHRINQKPGRPMWFGMSRDAKPVFALPGNPVSTLLCMTRYVLPAFRQAAGQTARPPEWVRLNADVDAPAGMTYFVPAKLLESRDGLTIAVPKPTNTSGDFITLADTDGFVELPPGGTRVPAGTIGRLYRW
jgi:molybdopterin molybdotransferase